MAPCIGWAETIGAFMAVKLREGGPDLTQSLNEPTLVHAQVAALEERARAQLQAASSRVAALRARQDKLLGVSEALRSVAAGSSAAGRSGGSLSYY